LKKPSEIFQGIDRLSQKLPHKSVCDQTHLGALGKPISDAPSPVSEALIHSLKSRDESYKVADENERYLHVTPSHGRLWKFKFRISTGSRRNRRSATSQHRWFRVMTLAM
jgi:hypothetical protein